ncbi:MAG: DUF4097 family beta strand repeat-containing protein [Acidimicrobiales bacterium]|jgi:hypothetical protein
MSETDGATATGRDVGQLEVTVERSFETPGTVSLRVENPSGGVEIGTHDAERTEVTLVALDSAADALVRDARISERRSARGYEVSVEIPHPRGLAKLWSGGGVQVLVKLPSDAELDVSTASASITARGRYKVAVMRSASGAIAVEEITGAAKIRTASGGVDLGTVGDVADVQSASGDVRIGVAASGGKVSTASGDVALGRVERPARVRAASGEVRLGEVLQGADIETISGDQRVERAAAGDLVMRAVSGDIVVSVVPGSLVRFDAGSLSGNVASDIDVESSRPVGAEQGEVREVSIQAKTVSGDISVLRATP